MLSHQQKQLQLKKFLGGNVKVLASMGHIRDLPKSKLAIDIENDFTPEYINIRGKGALIKTLKKKQKMQNMCIWQLTLTVKEKQ